MEYIKVSEIEDNILIWSGAIFRHFNVGRLDAATSNDDYFDLMLFDLDNIFYLINITNNTNKRGVIEIIIENIETEHFITASKFKKYFKNNSDIYFVKDRYNVMYFSKE